jgi:c-di-GMP-related signal transduction protein
MDGEVHDACRRLKQAGYQLALDDFEERPDWKPLVAIADYIKVDLLATTPADQLHLAQTYLLPTNIRLVAEKVETYDDFHLAPCARRAESANDLFLLGLLSAMGAILDMRMPDVLREITIHQEIRDALMGKANQLREIFEFALNYERGRWDEIGPAAARLGIQEDVIPALYVEAVEWARQILSPQQEIVSPRA